MLRDRPASRGAALFAEAYDSYEREAKQNAAITERARAGELIDLRLIGPHAEHGRMPLRHMLDILMPFERGLAYAAYRLRNGKDATKMAEKDSSAMGLQIAGVATGSTRFLIVGDSRADLTGVNIFDSTLTQAFRLLTAPHDSFYDAVDAVGARAARYVGESLEQIERHGLATELTLQRDNAEWLRWEGTPGEIRRVRTLIDSTSEPERFEQEISGKVATLRDIGGIVLRNGSRRVSVKFPLKLLEQVQKLKIGAEVRLKVSTAAYWNSALKQTVEKHTLIEVP